MTSIFLSHSSCNRIRLRYSTGQIERNDISRRLQVGNSVKLAASIDTACFHSRRIFTVVTFAAMSIGRSVAMVPSYGKGKISAKRILALNERQSAIDPDDPSGITLVGDHGERARTGAFLSFPSSLVRRDRTDRISRCTLSLSCSSEATHTAAFESGVSGRRDDSTRRSVGKWKVNHRGLDTTVLRSTQWVGTARWTRH